MVRREGTNPRKWPIQDRSRFTVEQIVEAATQVFTERGYAGATTNHIAERAGVAIGSPYQYFPNKAAILVVLAKHHIEVAGNMLVRLMTRRSLLENDLTELLRLFV